jgi:bifunctional non-homologous end joining protein LigD
MRQEFVIGGYTDPHGARTGIGSLLLGYYDKDGVLRYAGNCGSGFNGASLRHMREVLEAIETTRTRSRRAPCRAARTTG